MEIHENHKKRPTEEDKNTRTLFCDSLFRLWNIRVLLYTLVFLWAAVSLYREFVVEALEAFNSLNVSPYHFVWRTFNEGIGVSYMACYLLLIILFLIELAVCEFCTLYGAEDEELIKISKRIRIGIVIVCLLITCFIPFLLK